MTQSKPDAMELTIGMRIRDARKSLQLRQSDLAERVGISGSHLSDIERGTLIPTIPTLQKIAQALDRPLEYFLTDASNTARSLGTVIPRMSVFETLSVRFAELVHEKTTGEISIQAYRHALPSAFYDQVKGLVGGSIHIFIDDLFAFEQYAPLCGAICLPYFFQDQAQYTRFLHSEIFRTQISDRLLEQGVRLLNVPSDHGYGGFELLFSRTPIFVPADLVGRKFRSYDSELADAWRRYLGAEPVRTVWGQDNCIAFEQDVIDTFLMPALHFASIALPQVARYATLLAYGYLPSMVIAINEREYRKLPPDVQHQLSEAANEVSQEFSQEIQVQSRSFVDSLPDSHNVPIIIPNNVLWRERVGKAVREACLSQAVLTRTDYNSLQQL